MLNVKFFASAFCLIITSWVSGALVTADATITVKPDFSQQWEGAADEYGNPAKKPAVAEIPEAPSASQELRENHDLAAEVAMIDKNYPAPSTKENVGGPKKEPTGTRFHQAGTPAPANETEGERGLMTALAILIAVIVAICLFLLPTVIAFSRQHRNRFVIMLINIVFGATGLGWIGSLIWALNKIDDPVKGGSKHDSQPHDPVI